MATNPRFDVPASSPDNAAYVYPNSHRSHYSAGSGGPNLDRASSFRESHEGSGRGAGPPFSNAGNVVTHAELPPLSQVLSLEQIAFGDPKSKQPELRRAIAAALALIGESHGGWQPKSIEQQGQEELKRIRSSLLENSSKAKDRSRFLLEAITKLDKYRTSIQSRKRPRLEGHGNERTLISVSGERPVPAPSAAINPSKPTFCASPSHGSMAEGSMPKLEEKNAGPVPKKRVRTSMSDVRVEGRANVSSFQRSSGLADRDREPMKTGSSIGGLSDEKDRLVAPSEAWEKTKTKGRRSTTKPECVMAAPASGVSDIEREHKWGMHHRSNSENRPRSTEGHSFRPGPVHGVMSMHKSAIRNESDSTGPSGEKESRFIFTDKDRPTPTAKSGVKLATHKDDGSLISPTTSAKAKAARAPRSGTGIPGISNSSHAPRPPSNEVWDRTPAVGAPSRAQLPVGPSNRKRPAPTRSSSPPVTQWGGQRPQKMSRVARRMNITPPIGPPGSVGTRDENVPNVEVGSIREPTPTGVRPNASSSSVAGLVKRVSSTPALSQIKSKPDRVASPAGISESDDSEGADIKSKEKWKKHVDPEARYAPVNQKMAPLFAPGKKSRVGPRDEGGDGMRRQGRSGRATIAVRDSTNITHIEKGVPSASAKQLRSARPGPDKTEKPLDVKPGRPPSKKGGLGDRKALTRPRRPASSIAGDVSGESDDDHEEMVAAVQAAVNASVTACSSLFWKEIEPFFAYLTPDARNSLKIQVKARELEDEELLPSLTSDCKSEKAQNTPLDSTAVGRATYFSNGTMDVNGNSVAKTADPKSDHVLDGNKAGLSGGWPMVKELPLSQRLLAALIIEGDLDDDSREDRSQLELQDYVGDGSSHDLSDSEQAGLEKDQDSESEVETRRGTGKLNGRAKSSSYDVSYTSNGHRHWDSESELLNSPVKSELKKDEDKQSSDINGPNKWEGKYQCLTLDERIGLELQSLGLYPDQGDLLAREDDQIADEVKRSQLELKELVHVNKERLSTLEKVVCNARVSEEREKDRLAMIKLLESAFNKRLGIRGGHLGVSGSKNAASKAGRAAAVAIAKRSLARWKHYAETAETCFNETGLREILFCTSLKEGEIKALSNAGEVHVGINTLGLTLTGSSELKLAVSAGSRWICRAYGTEKVDKESCESDQLAVATPSERTGDKDDIWCTRSKEREVLLEYVGGSGSGGSVLCGTKGKRSERDGGTGKGSGRQALGAIKGERKTKTKPRQKTAPLLKAVNGLLGKSSELSDKSGVRIKQESMGVGISSIDVQAEVEGPLDLAHLQIPGMDELVGNGDLAGQGQDLGSWLDFDDPQLTETGDLMGLDVPMDDLADLSMIM